MKLFIRSMSTERCNMFVISILEQLDIKYDLVQLGCVDLPVDITIDQRANFSKGLYGSGLELIEDAKEVLVEKIKIAVHALINLGESLIATRNSDFISHQLGYDYTYLANVFSQHTGNTIEQYIISTKVERVKQLLTHNELSLTEISYKLNYCSVAHLSAQFKKITGITASYFRKCYCYSHLQQV